MSTDQISIPIPGQIDVVFGVYFSTANDALTVDDLWDIAVSSLELRLLSTPKEEAYSLRTAILTHIKNGGASLDLMPAGDMPPPLRTGPAGETTVPLLMEVSTHLVIIRALGTIGDGNIAFLSASALASTLTIQLNGLYLRRRLSPVANSRACPRLVPRSR